MKKLSFWSLLFIFIFAGYFSSAGQSLLDRVQQKYNSAAAISADIKQAGGNSEYSGKVFFKTKNKFRLEFKNFTIVSDGSTIWNYNLKENKVIISSYDENDPSTVSLHKILNEYPEKNRVTAVTEGKKEILIFVPLPESMFNFERLRLTVNNENLVEKIEVQKDGSPMLIYLSNYNLNQDMPDSRFTFTPSEKTQIIDIR